MKKFAEWMRNYRFRRAAENGTRGRVRSPKQTQRLRIGGKDEFGVCRAELSPRLCSSRCGLCFGRPADPSLDGSDMVRPQKLPQDKARARLVRGKGRRKLGPVLAAALLGAALLQGCGRHQPTPDTTAALPVAQVRVQPVVAKLCVASEEIPGTVRPKTRAVLEAKVAGRITELPVGTGQHVKAGDLIARLDANEIKARLDQARAMLEQARRDRDRYTALLAQQAVTQAEFDGVMARYRVAEASVLEAETMLGYAEVRAPFDGVVNRKFADVGELAAPGKPLVELEAARGFRFEADVPEAFIGQIRLDTKLPVRIDALDATVEGAVTEIAAGGDPTSRTIHVKVDLPDAPGLRSGLFGRLTLPVSERTALCVPTNALVKRGQLDIVFVVAGGKAQMRLVKPGKRLGDTIELLSGVESGELVVVEGAEGLLDGQPVQLK